MFLSAAQSFFSHPVFGEGGLGSSSRFGVAERAPALPSPASGEGIRKAFRVGLVFAAASLVCPAGYAQVETADPGIVSGTLARIKQTGTVRLGYREASIPF